MKQLSTFFIPCNLHWLFFATVAFCSGIWLGAYFSWIYVAIGVIIGVGSKFLFKQKTVFILGLSIACMVGTLAYRHQLACNATFYTLVAQHNFDVQATVTHILEISGNRKMYCITVKTSSVTLTDPQRQEYPLCVNLQIYLPKKIPVLVGDFIEINNLKIKKPKESSYKWYLIKENIAASIFANSLTYQEINRPPYSIARFIANTKDSLMQQCKKKLNFQTFALFSSIFLGNRSVTKKQSVKTNQYYQTWGISHYLARSGLHLVIFVFVWHIFLNLLPIAFNIKQWLLLLLCIIYYIFSWSSVSFIRAFITFIFYKICTLGKVPIILLHLLCLVSLIVLFFNPLQLFFLDFQLSFGLTFALAWFAQIKHQKKSPAFTNY